LTNREKGNAMPDISAAVGPGAPNASADVTIVQNLLIRHRRWLNGVAAPQENGQFDQATAAAIIGFQKDGCALLNQDGRVDKGGFTIRRLNMTVIPGPQHRIFADLCWAQSGGLTDQSYVNAATALGCEEAAIRAVARVETKRKPFDEVGRPSILFERHYFSRCSGNQFNVTHSDISHTRRSGAGGYGTYSAQYVKLRRAAMLHEEAALRSASWGMFQIMGDNHVAAGYPTVNDFVTGMMVSEQKHLDAFVAFIRANATILRALRNKEWATFAAGYNGPDYRDNNYDVEMRL
jgi:N-acetylmuramidase